jgi:HAD superfamily hydrolase (TIGR01549 family)
MKTILFDLDGTLIGMELEAFTQAYVQSITAFMSDVWDPKAFGKSLMKGLYAMVSDMGENTNEQTFWNSMEADFGQDMRTVGQRLLSYYENEFEACKSAIIPRKEAQDFINRAKGKYRLVLATNPVFPIEAVKKRLEWGGIDLDAFEYISVYDNSTQNKPHAAYYQELIDKLDLDPAECIMVGNDVQEDGAAKLAGIDVFIVEGWVINRTSEPTQHQGSWSDLIAWAEEKGFAL